MLCHKRQRNRHNSLHQNPHYNNNLNHNNNLGHNSNPDHNGNHCR